MKVLTRNLNLILLLFVVILCISIFVDDANAASCWGQGAKCQRRRCFPRLRIRASGCPASAPRCCSFGFGFRGNGTFIEEGEDLISLESLE
ncbi:unnamed protein product [Orchesella dallaii]|uniref:Uncharacterized protein n=1 Tax=Orchesella dallaii TaxID=48710 RepID=A0ABP1S8P6_9HEXA